MIIGIISGVIASVIVLVVTWVYNYVYRMKTEKCIIYDLEYIGERDVCAPPEYPRETIFVEPKHEEGVTAEYYETADIVKLQFPFDILKIQIYAYGELIYPTDDIDHLPAGESVYVNCKLSLGDEIPAFVVKCKTFKHEYREYEYTTVYKYSGGYSRFGLKMTKQSFFTYDDYFFRQNHWEISKK